MPDQKQDPADLRAMSAEEYARWTTAVIAANNQFIRKGNDYVCRICGIAFTTLNPSKPVITRMIDHFRKHLNKTR